MNRKMLTKSMIGAISHHYACMPSKSAFSISPLVSLSTGDGDVNSEHFTFDLSSIGDTIDALSF